MEEPCAMPHPHAGHDRGKYILKPGGERGPEPGVATAHRSVSEGVPNTTPVRVAVFSTHDSGGAGIAARRLHEGSRAIGCESEMFVADLSAPAPHVQLLPGSDVAALDGGRRHFCPAWLRAENRGNARISAAYPGHDRNASTFSGEGHVQELGATPFVEEYDILHLHWIANFLALPSSPAVLKGRPIVWTLHDMRPFTGGCHYAGDCERFMERCGACPQLGSGDEEDLSFQIWRGQMARYRKRALHIVAPSRWLAGLAEKSGLFRNLPVHVIENGHPLDIFKPLDRRALRTAGGMREEEFVIGFSAGGLNATRKGMRYLLACLERLAASSLKDSYRVFLMGDTPPEEVLRCGIRVETMGSVADPATAAAYYNMLDVLLVPSLEDNMPNVIAEAAGCGTPTIAFAVGGIAGMVEHGGTGLLAPVGDDAALAEAVRLVQAGQVDGTAACMRERCRAVALERWELQKQALRYKELFLSLRDGREE